MRTLTNNPLVFVSPPQVCDPGQSLWPSALPVAFERVSLKLHVLGHGVGNKQTTAIGLQLFNPDAKTYFGVEGVWLISNRYNLCVNGITFYRYYVMKKYIIYKYTYFIC